MLVSTCAVRAQLTFHHMYMLPVTQQKHCRLRIICLGVFIAYNSIDATPLLLACC